MASYVIEGGKKLNGILTTNSSKNVAVVLMMASLLNRGRTILRNVPHIEEVNRLSEVLESMGVLLFWKGHDLTIQPPKKLDIAGIDYAAGAKTRSIIFLLTTALSWQKSFKVPQPGGCRLGSRTVAPHLYALENFGIRIKTTQRYFEVTHKYLRSNKEVVLYEAGDTVTENAILAAAQTSATTKISFATANYMGQELCFYLEKLGVKIKGIGTTSLEISGKKSFKKNVEYTLAPDPIESMLFISIAATTKSSLVIRQCPIDFLKLELLKLEKMGFLYEITSRYKAKNGKTNLVDIKTHPSVLQALEEKIHAQPYPGINIDNLPFFVPIATQAKGKTLIFDWTYENRAIYYMELNKLGARIELADPHRAFVDGPVSLKAAEVICPPALRPGTIILVGMLAAKGKSVLRNIYSIERGYENLCERLSKVGAKITKID